MRFTPRGYILSSLSASRCGNIYIRNSRQSRHIMSAPNSRAGSPAAKPAGSTTAPLIEGVFAVHKPTGITSAQVLRDIQTSFSPSVMFSPWIKAERDRLSDNSSQNGQQRGRRNRQFVRNPQVKVGHGGTLDPLATGVLIVGIGSGTKALGGFLECTKSYDTTMLFGASTDSYDSEGRILDRAPTDNISDSNLREKLEKEFSGQISQIPPVYSALKVNGKALYDYARNGEEIPTVKAREVNVLDVKLVEFLKEGSHPFMLPPDRPAVVPSQDRKAAAGGKKDRKKRKRDEPVGADGGAQKKMTVESRGSVEVGENAVENSTQEDTQASTASIATTATADATESQTQTSTAENTQSVVVPAVSETTTTTTPSIPQDLLPAARVEMTVSSGFYVRSLCHDLATSLGSAAHMVRLVRTRQGDFSLHSDFPDLGVAGEGEGGEAVENVNEHPASSSSSSSFIPVLPYEDLTKGEEVWAPKVAYLLNRWDRVQKQRQQEEEKKE